MTEKVLGFKEKDAKFRCCGDSKLWQAIYLKKSKLVPVVSLEWLYHFCNEEKDDIIYELANVRVQQLLEAAKKEAEKK